MSRTDTQFREIRVAELYCRDCRCSRPVSTRLLFELPHREYQLRCFVCDLVLGARVDDDGDGW